MVIAEPSACTANIVQDFDAPAVDEDGAGAALTGVAPDVGAGQAQMLAKDSGRAAGADRRCPCAPCR